VTDAGWFFLAVILAPVTIVAGIALASGYHFSLKAWKPITRHTEIEDAEPSDHTE
jgi:hypothetical protein